MIKSPRELNVMREAGQLVAGAHDVIRSLIKPGVTTGELDAAATRFVAQRSGRMAFKGYRGFPGHICASLNEEVVHGIPGRRTLRQGDILSVDIGVQYKNLYGDAAVTLSVGRIARDVQRLLEATREALELAIRAVRPGARLSDIGRAIEGHAASNGYGVVRKFVGHGIGYHLHEEPQVPNFVVHEPGFRDIRLRPGMVLAIEPMFNLGTHQVEEMDNRWTIVTADGKWSAHFEHTVAVTKQGNRVLTLP